MKTIFILCLFTALTMKTFCQVDTIIPTTFKETLSARNDEKNLLDSALEVNSEKWKVKLHNAFSIAKPEFGPYSTIGIEKLDSPVLKKRTKEGSSSSTSITSDGWDWDFSKYEKTEKKRAYRMLIVKDVDTAELLFSWHTVSHDKKLTFFGEMISKNDEGKNQRLSYNRKLSGILTIAYDTMPSRFFIEDSSGSGSFPFEMVKIRWYLVTAHDSLYTEPFMLRQGKPDKKFYLSDPGIYVNNSAGARIAALKFGNTPFNIWIRKDIDSGQQHAIASLLSLMMVAKTSHP